MENPGLELRDSNRNSTLQFRPDIEGLRAIAVVLVVLYHAGLPILHGGFIGVDVFFVLSGYLITSLLTKELSLTGAISLPRFYARRVRRLLPASILVVAAVCLTEAILASPLAQYEVLKAAASTTLYSSNIYFAIRHRDYFLSGFGTNPLIHTWSLAVEEQFYLVWPILLLLVTRARKGIRTRVIVLSVLTLVSFACCIWLTWTSQVTAYYQMAARAWEFGAGGLASCVSIQWLTEHRRLCKWAGIAGLLTIVLSGAFLTRSASFPGYIAAIPVLGTLAALLAGAGAPNARPIAWLNLRPFQFFGKISYSLYLWHWPVLRIANDFLPIDSVAVRACSVALAVALSALTFALVENPIRFKPSLVSRSWLSLGAGALATTLLVAGFAGWRVALFRSGQFQKFRQVALDMPAFYKMDCSGDARPKLCYFGETAKPTATVVLFGDSHAIQWFQPVKEIAEAHHWKLVTVIKVACSPIGIKSGLGGPRASERCDLWRAQAIAEIRVIHPDMVIMSSSSLYQKPDSSNLVSASEWEQRSRETFLSLAERGTSVKFIRDTPHADYDVPSCLAQQAWNGLAACVPLHRSSALDSDIYDAEKRAAAHVENVQFIDLSDVICSGDICGPQKNGLVLYSDKDHLAASFTESLKNVLEKRLMQAPGH